MTDEAAYLSIVLPGLAGSDYAITSSATDDYNCIAWAIGETERWWDPFDPKRYWPAGIPRDDSVESIAQCFAAAGFSICEHGDHEPGIEKLALYADDEGFTHVARQLESGRWTSKLGDDVDVEHDLDALTTSANRTGRWRYGEIAAYMSRPRRG